MKTDEVYAILNQKIKESDTKEGVTPSMLDKAVLAALQAAEDYTDAAVGNIVNFNVSVVDNLPTEDIDTHTIYFVSKESGTHDEYMYINGTWELIGNTEVDLSGYATIEKLENLTAEDVGALSLKKGGTVNNTFKVNKVSTTNPTGLTEIDIHNDGKIAFNTDGKYGGNINDSLVYLQGDDVNGRVTINGGELNIKSSTVTFNNQIEGVILRGVNQKLYASSNLEILAEGLTLGYDDIDSQVGLESTLVASRMKLEDDRIDMYFINRSTNQRNTELPSVHIDDVGVNIRGLDIELGPSGNQFIQCVVRSLSTPGAFGKETKLRGGTNANMVFEANNDIAIGSENGIIYFKSYPDSIPIMWIDTKNKCMYVYNAMNIGETILDTSFIEARNMYSIDVIDSASSQGGTLNFYISNDGIFQCRPIETEDNGYVSAELGTSYFKWTNIYATNGTIQTSDRNEKNSIEELTDEKAQQLIYGLKPSTYQMNSGTSGRTHWGMISQDIEELLDELNWTSFDFAGFIKSPKMRIEEEERDPETGKIIKKRIEEVIEGEYDYSLRYDEFIAPLIKTVQAQHSEIENLKQEMTLLKQQIQDLLNREV